MARYVQKKGRQPEAGGVEEGSEEGAAAEGRGDGQALALLPGTGRDGALTPADLTGHAIPGAAGLGGVVVTASGVVAFARGGDGVV